MTTENLTLLELFTEEELSEFKEEGNGSLRGPCPQCGRGSGGADPFIIFPDRKNSFCHKTQRNFNFLELAAMKNRLINCPDGRESGEKGPINGKMFFQTLEVIEEEYGIEILDKVYHEFNIKKPIILPGNGRLISKFVKDLSNIIKQKNILFYRHEAKDVVEIARIKGSKEEMTYTGFSGISPNRFITLIERYSTPKIEVITKNGIALIDRSMGKETSSTTLASQEFQEALPQISRIFSIPIPIIYEGVLTFPQRGYDSRFNSWLPFNAPTIEKEDMTLEEAKNIIYMILKEFCLQDKKDYTNAVAALITPYLRGLFPSFNTRTPVFFYIANRERAGKDYLAGINGILYEGHALEESPISSSENSKSNNTEELRKKILAAFISGKKRMHFSNNKGHINNAVFESVTTATKYSDRILGKSEVLSFDNELDFSLSGNIGVSYTPDFANRCKFIRLFLEIEDANSRKFENPDLHKWILEHRGLILSAFYSLIKNWINSGMKKGNVPFTSFPAWSEICGGVMEAAGYDNPCSPDKDVSALGGDNETTEMKNLFELCYSKFPEQRIKREDIKNLIISDGNNDIFGYLDLSTKPDQTKLGLKITKFIGRVLSGIRLVLIESDCRASRQELKFTKEVNCNSGNLGNFGNDKSLVYNNFKASDLMLYVANVTDVAKSPNLSLISSNIPKFGHLDSKNKPIKAKKQPKTDREIQFYDAPECQNIVSECTKEQVLEYIRTTAKLPPNYKELDQKLGLGALKWRNELLSEGKIKVNEKGGFEII